MQEHKCDGDHTPFSCTARSRRILRMGQKEMCSEKLTEFSSFALHKDWVVSRSPLATRDDIVVSLLSFVIRRAGEFDGEAMFRPMRVRGERFVDVASQCTRLCLELIRRRCSATGQLASRVCRTRCCGGSWQLWRAHQARQNGRGRSERDQSGFCCREGRPGEMLRVSSAAIGAALVPAQRLPAQRAGAVSTVASARPSSRGQCVIVVATNGGRRPGARRSSTGNRNNPSSPQSPQRDGQAAPPAVKIGSAGSAPQKAGPQSPAPATVVAAAPATLQPAKAVPVAAAAPATAAALAAEKAPVAVASASSTVAESGSAPGTPQKADEKPSAKKNKYNLQGEEDFDGLVRMRDFYSCPEAAVPDNAGRVAGAAVT